MENSNIFFPVAIKIAARTISSDLVSVSPMGTIPNSDQIDHIVNRIKQENRDSRIDSILNNSTFKEKKIEDDEEYIKIFSKPRGVLNYLDFKYNI